MNNKLIESNIGIIWDHIRKYLKLGIITVNDIDEVYEYLADYLCRASKSYSKKKGAFSTYVYGAFRFAIKNYLETTKNYRERYKLFPEVTPHGKDDVANKSFVDDTSDDELLFFLICRAKLTNKETKFLKLHYMKELSCSEIGEKNNISKEGARKVIVVAVQKIRNIAEQYEYKIENFY